MPGGASGIIFLNWNGRDDPVLPGQRREIQDLQTGQTVGFVYLDVNQDFLGTESSGFLRELLLSFIAAGCSF